MLCAKIIEIGSSLLKLFKIKLVTFLRHAVFISTLWKRFGEQTINYKIGNDWSSDLFRGHNNNSGKRIVFSSYLLLLFCPLLLNKRCATFAAISFFCAGGKGVKNRTIYDDPVDAYTYAIFWSSVVMLRRRRKIHKTRPFILQHRSRCCQPVQISMH